MIGLQSGAYPYVMRDLPYTDEIPPLQAAQIHGELYEVSEDVLELLDRLEEHPNHYVRKHVLIENGYPAEMYLIEDTEFKECILQGIPLRFRGIPNGIWENKP